MTAIGVFRWVLALALILYSTYVLTLGQDGSFVPVKAKVIESQKEYSSVVPTHRLPKVELVFEYIYDYNGTNYRSKRYSHGPVNSGPPVATYKPGDRLTAFVNPEQPEYSVIERGVPMIVYGLLVIGILMIVNLSLELIVSTLKSKNREPSERLIRCFRLSAMMVGFSILIVGVSYFSFQIWVAS